MLEYVRREAQDSQSRIEEHGVLRSHRQHPVDAESEEKRADQRVGIVDRVRATIFVDEGTQLEPEGGQLRVVRDGFTRDLSIRGTCVYLEGSFSKIPVESVIGQTAKIRLEFMDEGRVQQVNALGRIAWGKEQSDGVMLGVQFLEIPGNDRKSLEQHCAPDAGEQSLLFQLWESEVSRKSNQESNLR